MADSDKIITITPNTGSSTNFPKIEFTGADNNTVTANVLDNGTVSFEGTDGQLFSVVDSLSGDLYTVSDISGIPSIHLKDDGELQLAPYYGNLLVGHTDDNGEDKLQVRGQMSVHSDSGQLFKLEDNPNSDLLNVADMSGISMLQVQNNGAVKTPFSPLFCAKVNNGTGSGSTAPITTSWQTPLVNTVPSAWDSSTGKYTIPVSGVYEVTMNASMYSSSSSADSRYIAVRLVLNGSYNQQAHAAHGPFIASSHYSHRGFTVFGEFSKGDEIQMQIDSAVSGAIVNSEWTGMTIRLIA